MTPGPDRLPPAIAVSKNAEAMQLLRKGRLRDALRALNEAIYAAPDYPPSYANRAVVFERLGMLPQADGDRRRASELDASSGYAEIEMAAASPLPAPAPPRRSRAPQRPAGSLVRRTRSRLGGLPETSVLLIGILGMAATAVGIFLAVNALSAANIDLNIFDFDSFQGGSESETTPEPTPAETDPPTPPPATPPPEALAGNPFSLSNLQTAWQSRGMTVTPGALSSGFSGFKAQPFDVRLSRGGDSASVSVLIYPNRDAPKEDWNLSAGSRPSAKAGRSVPAHDSIWWNTNVIVVARNSGGDVGRDALAAFLALGG